MKKNLLKITFALTIAALSMLAIVVSTDTGESDALNPSWSEGGYTYDPLTEEGTTGTASVIEGPTSGNITIPASAVKYGITYTISEINTHAFDGCTGLTSVTIPSSVTTLSGFKNCTGLTSVTIPSSVTSLDGAFGDCTGLTSVTILSSATPTINSFIGCICTLRVPTDMPANNITVPSTVTVVRYAAVTWTVGETSTTDLVDVGQTPTYAGTLPAGYEWPAITAIAADSPAAVTYTARLADPPVVDPPVVDPPVVDPPVEPAKPKTSTWAIVAAVAALIAIALCILWPSMPVIITTLITVAIAAVLAIMRI